MFVVCGSWSRVSCSEGDAQDIHIENWKPLDGWTFYVTSVNADECSLKDYPCVEGGVWFGWDKTTCTPKIYTKTQVSWHLRSTSRTSSNSNSCFQSGSGFENNQAVRTSGSNNPSGGIGGHWQLLQKWWLDFKMNLWKHSLGTTRRDHLMARNKEDLCQP
jgi:hypothetical protein